MQLDQIRKQHQLEKDGLLMQNDKLLQKVYTLENEKLEKPSLVENDLVITNKQAKVLMDKINHSVSVNHSDNQ